ncbi:MAG: GntR family transcriptional regulator, partial [Thermoleophilia bacterium]
ACDEERARACLGAYAAARGQGDDRAARAAHAGFHFALYEASGSRWLVRLIRPAWENSERYRALSLKSRGFPDRQHEHERILAACVRHDPEAAAAELRRHLALTANLVARQMGSSDLFPER